MSSLSMPLPPRSVIAQQLERLAAVFGRSEVDETALDGYREALAGLSPTAVDAAVRVCIRQERFFPRPSVLRRHALEHQAQQATADAHDPASALVCRRCHTHRWYAGYRCPDGAIHPRLRCHCDQGPGWDDPAARAWTEDDPRLLAAGFRPPAEVDPR